MDYMTKKEVNKKIKLHKLWLHDKNTGEQLHLINKQLIDINLSNLDLSKSNLSDSNLTRSTLIRTILTDADLSNVYLANANLSNAYLINTNLSNANLIGANLANANLRNVNLTNADLTGAILTNAYLTEANLTNVTGLVKQMGVEPGNIYWKRFNKGLINFTYQFKVGLNKLHKGEIFASDPRLLCSSPGFHFASRSWCATNYPEKPLEAKIQIPKNAEINEPWATDGKASANMIKILQIFDVKTGNDVTDLYR